MSPIQSTVSSIAVRSGIGVVSSTETNQRGGLIFGYEGQGVKLGTDARFLIAERLGLGKSAFAVEILFARD